MREIIKAIFKTGSASIVSIILGVISTKILAVALGSSGMGLYSIINQTLSTATTAGTMGGQTALVQGLASKKGNERDKYLITVFWIFIFGAMATSLFFWIFSPLIAQTVFASNDEETISLVRWITLPLTLTIIYSYFTNLLNGFKAIGRLAIAQVIVSFVTLLFVYPLFILASSGHTISFIFLISVSTMGGIIFSIIVAHKEKWLNPLIKDFIPKIDRGAMKHFYYMSRARLATGLVTSGTLLVIRAMIIQYEGFSSAGIFDVAWALSMTYIMLLLSSFGTYYLPTLSGIEDPQSRITLVQETLKMSLIIVIPLIITIIELKPLVIAILYTHEFIKSLEIVRWMLIGDYLKVSSWILSIPMVAYADMKSFFWSEIIWNAGFLMISCLAIYYNHLEGIGISFLLMYAIYLVYMKIYCEVRFQIPITKKMTLHWVAGLALVLAASFYDWNTTVVSYSHAAVWITCGCLVSWISLEKDEKYELVKLIFGTKNGIKRQKF